MFSKDANGNGESAYRQPRLMMVKNQLEARGIRDKQVLKAMRELPRHLFVPEAFRLKAYDDSALPIGEEQTISQPYMVAVMTELLELTGTEKVLEIGTGSGYQTAVLGKVAMQVYSVERIQKLLVNSRRLLENLGYTNCALKVFDGTLGWSDFAPYDAIIITAGGPELPKPLLDQLKTGGKLVMPIGGMGGQILRKFVKTPSGTRETKHTACTFVKLVGEYGWKENGK